MPQAIIDLGEQEDQILKIVKGKFNLKNKSDAINLIIGKFAEQMEDNFQLKTTARYLREKEDPWMLAEDIPDIDFFFFKIPSNTFVLNSTNPYGQAFYKKVLNIYRGYHLWWYIGEKDSLYIEQKMLQQFLKNPSSAEEVNLQIIHEADKLHKFALTIPETGLQQLTPEQLNFYYTEQERIHQEYYRWCWIPVVVDMFHSSFTNALKDYLKQKKIPPEKLNNYFITLTKPSQKSLMQIEQEEFYQLVLEIQKEKEQNKLFLELYQTFQEQQASPFGLKTHTPEYEAALEKKVEEIRAKIKPTLLNKIKRHYQKYHYVKFMWIGTEGAYSFDYYLKELVKFIGQKSDAKVLLQEMEQERTKGIAQKEKLMKELKIEDKWKILFNSFGEFMTTKIYRRYAQIFAVYRMQPILKEIARRLNLSLMQVRFMATTEIELGLLQGKVNPIELQKRTELCVYYVDNQEQKIFTGIEAKRIAEELEQKEVQEVKEFKGQVGCTGIATGTVKIIIRPEDMSKMNPGDILVSIATDPDIVPAMKKAAAFVTEQGGVTSHAAIVAREMNKPCVIGTKIATKVLKDGDVVEVDANKGIVKILKRA